ncbi:uncharacterized protein A4U43_C08F14680 [Asparagus officinalis]|nr:uncharacterized protein A4U43_C08F14680 [Asparagus officinalis]
MPSPFLPPQLFKDRSPPRDFAHRFRSAPIKSGLFRFLAILDSEARLGLESCSASQIDAVIFAANPPGDDVGSAPATAVIGEGHVGGGGRRPMKQRLLVVANRLPVSAVRRGEESWSLDISAGGLVSALLGDISAATEEDVNLAVEVARIVLKRNGGKEWARAMGAFRAKYLRAIAAKILLKPWTRSKEVLFPFLWIHLSPMFFVNQLELLG